MLVCRLPSATCGNPARLEDERHPSLGTANALILDKHYRRLLLAGKLRRNSEGTVMSHTSKIVASSFVFAVIALSLLVPTVARAGGRGKRVTRTVLNFKPAPAVPVFDLATAGCGQNYISSAELI
jgi:hypothetical protein